VETVNLADDCVGEDHIATNVVVDSHFALGSGDISYLFCKDRSAKDRFCLYL